jgi:hypothetical protein
MLKLGFDVRWVDLIMRIVPTVTFSVLFNGTPSEALKPTRGIRQGDPISLYLFLLAAEGLSFLLKSRIVIPSLKLQGLKVASSTGGQSPTVC